MKHRWSGNNTVTYGEWEEWRERQKRQARDNPDYQGAFARPSYATATRILRLLKKWIVDLAPIYLAIRLTLDKNDQRRRRKAAEIGLVVGLAAFLHRGSGMNRITYTMLVDALARKFSDHYLRAARVAPSLSYMRKDTVQSIGRDLLLSGVSPGGIWNTLVGFGRNPRFPLYEISEHRTGDEKAYFVAPRINSRLYKTIMRAMQYFSQPEPPRKLLRIAQISPPQGPHTNLSTPVDVDYDVCAEWKYNVVALTQRSKVLLRTQEDARLVFDVGVFKQDYLDRNKLARQVRRSIRRKYDIDPGELSTSPRTHSRRRNHRKGKRSARRTWSQREEAVYYRSIEIALTKEAPAVEGPLGLQGRGPTRRRVSLRKKTIGNFLEWIKRTGRRLSRRILPKTPKEKLAAARRATEWRARIESELNAYDKHCLFSKAFGRVYEQVKAMKQHRLVTCRFGRMMNRRFKALDFWPTYVSAKAPSEGLPHLADSLIPSMIPDGALEAYRVRWFKAFDPATKKVVRLAGRDVSSSQMQILAFLSGDAHLEECTTNKRQSFKQWLAKKAWEWNARAPQKLLATRPGIIPYQPPDPNTQDPDRRLQELVKELIMRVSYGSKAKTVEIAQANDPGWFGPAWTENGAQHFLDRVWREFPVMQRYLAQCARLAAVVAKYYPYRGLELTDPSDGARVRWNPPQIRTKPLRIKVDHRDAFIWVPADRPNRRGDYPVHEPALKSKVAPCVIHLLDAYYSAVVMTNLRKLGVKTLVGIHDCWLVPEHQTGLLEKAMQRAAREWYRGLRSIFRDLRRYARYSRRLTTFVRGAHRCWRRRLRTGKLPEFRAKTVRA